MNTSLIHIYKPLCQMLKPIVAHSSPETDTVFGFSILTGAVKLDWRKAEFFGNVCVLDLQRFINLQHESSDSEMLRRWLG